MCVRYVGKEARDSRWGGAPKTAAERGLFGPRELFPGERGVFVNADGEVVEGLWGLQPAWAKDPHFGRKNAYNARGETVAEKPTFRSAFRHRRCVVHAEAFFERAEGRWLRVVPTEREQFSFAALWEEPNERTEGLPTYTLVTTEPNAAVEGVHDRMPVVLAPEDAARWVSPDAPTEGLRVLLGPCPPEWTRVEDAGPIGGRRKSGAQAGQFGD